MYTDFQKFINNVAKFPVTLLFKLFLTSRTTPLYFRALLGSRFEKIRIKELHFEHADEMIARMVPALNSSIRCEIVNLTGNLPLALQITGTLLHQQDHNELSNALSHLQFLS